MNQRSSSVTIRDVARQAGVSVATVSRYINRNAPVSTQVAKRLDSIVSELRYVPHPAARHLASRKTQAAAVAENMEITYQLVEHLIRVHGRRRVMFLRGFVQQEDSIKRERGYRSALQANGIPFNENLILNGAFERGTAYRALNDFLGNDKRAAFDAVFTGDDDTAMGILSALHQHGLRVPEDVSVIGFDDRGFASFLNPPLTAVRAPGVGVPAERLLGLLENHPTTEIVYRRSCGCAAWA